MAARELAILLTARNQASGQIKKVTGDVSALERTSNRGGAGMGLLGRNMASVEKGAGRLGGAIERTSHHLTSFAGSVGLLAGGAGLFTLGGMLEEGINKATEFGGTVRRLTALTGLSTEQTSALSAAMEHFNISAETQTKLVGFLEKNTGALAIRKGGLAKFERAYGFALTGSNGKLKDANELLLTSADYFNNKAIPAGTKALALSKLYGRSWQELIPFLSAGRKGIGEAEQEAKDLGLTLTKDNLASLVKLKSATREWDTALGGLKLQIGLGVVPLLTDMAKGASAFLRAGGKDQIIGIFKGVSQFAKEAAGAIGSLAPIAKGVADAWNAIPADFRKILIGGVIANKALKMTLGFDPIDMARKTITNSLLGIRANVVNVSGGVVNGAGGGVAAKGGLGKVGTAVAALSIVGDIAAVVGTQQAISQQSSQQASDIAATQKAWLATSPKREDIVNGLAAVQKGIDDIQSNPLNVLVQGDALDKLKGMRADLQQSLAASADHGTQSSADRQKAWAGMRGEGEKLLPKAAMALPIGILAPKLDLLHHDLADGLANLAMGIRNNKPQGAAEAAAQIASAVAKGVGSVQGTQGILAKLQSARQVILSSGDKAALRQIDAAIRAVRAKIPGREWIAAQEAAARKIAASNEATGQKIRELKGIQQSLIAHGDSAAARIVGALLGGVVPAINGIQLKVGMVAFPQAPPGAQRAYKPATRPKSTSHPDMGSGLRAAGGPVTAGMPYTVGEKGPETFVPTRNGTIIPHGKPPVTAVDVTPHKGKRDGAPVWVTNWPSAGGSSGAGMSGSGGTGGGGFHVLRVNRHSARHDELLGGIHIAVKVHASARETAKAHKHWKRYGGNGAAVTLD